MGKCVVCVAAGKGDDVSFGHYPKDVEGVTICPTLLGQTCGYCFGKGHTPKYCEVAQMDLRKKKSLKNVADRLLKEEGDELRLAKAGKLTRIEKLSRGFNLLRSDSSDEDEDEDTEGGDGIRVQKVSSSGVSSRGLLLTPTKPSLAVISVSGASASASASRWASRMGNEKVGCVTDED